MLDVGQEGAGGTESITHVEDVVLGVHSKHPLTGEKQRKDAQDGW